MKKLISLLLAVLMLGAIFTGCGKTNAPAGSDDNAPVGGNSSVTSGSVADSYAAYMEAKSAMVTKLSDGLSNNPDTAFAALSMMGIAMVDLGLIPVSLFGLGQESMVSGLAFFGATGVEYVENGNNYTLSYKDEDGVTYEFIGAYDPSADALITTAKTNGSEVIYSEYRKTSYGYVGQYYLTSDDGTHSLYQIAVTGDDGTLGISTANAKPAVLSGSEAIDFPKACTEWYAVTGTTITGVTSDGTELNFEFTPTPTEE